MSTGPTRIFVLLVFLASVLAFPSPAAGHGEGEPSSEGEASSYEDALFIDEEPEATPTPTVSPGPLPEDEIEESLEDAQSTPMPTVTATPSLTPKPATANNKKSTQTTVAPGSPSLFAPSFECTAGFAGPFPCKNIDLLSALSLDIPPGGTDNDIWGWTDPKTDREYALVGGAVETAFVDVTDPENPRSLGSMPTSGIPDFVLWRDVKVDGHFAFVVSETTNHGMQVFDLRRLRGVEVPQIFEADVVYRGVDEDGIELGNSHNVAINEKTDYAYIVGSNTCNSKGPNGEIDNDDGQNGGLHMVDISNPLKPKFAGCALIEDPATHNYSHDVQCVIYKGPDADYRGREICFSSNEEVVAIYDVTNKNNPKVISQRDYPQVGYTHQGWLTADQRYFLFGDEGDETGSTVDNTTTYIMDAKDLDDLRVPKAFSHETRSIDHNLFIHEGLVHQSNYAAGHRILDFTNKSLKNGKLNEVGFFDTRPGVDEPEFVGVWSNYPYFDSGIVVTTDIELGSLVLFVLKPTGPASGEVKKKNDDKKKKDDDIREKPGDGKGDPEDPAQRDPNAGFVATDPGSTLSTTGAQIMLVLLLGLAMVAAGAAIMRMRRSEEESELSGP